MITISISFQVSAGLCYQESANTSNQTGIDGSCSLSYTGFYVNSTGWNQNVGFTVDNLIDGSFSTKTTQVSGIAFVKMNYTKPEGALSSSLWLIKDRGLSTITQNISILQSCWSQSILQLAVFAYREGIQRRQNWSCYNGTDWVNTTATHDGSTFGEIFEEAMWWNIPSNPCTACQDEDSITLTLDGSAIQNENAILLTLGEGVAANDTCTCPGLNQNWVVDMNDNCSLTVCELGTGTLSFTNTTAIGTAYCNGNINTTNMGPPPDKFTFFINSTCNIGVRS